MVDITDFKKIVYHLADELDTLLESTTTDREYMAICLYPDEDVTRRYLTNVNRIREIVTELLERSSL